MQGTPAHVNTTELHFLRTILMSVGAQDTEVHFGNNKCPSDPALAHSARLAATYELALILHHVASGPRMLCEPHLTTTQPRP